MSWQYIIPKIIQYGIPLTWKHPFSLLWSHFLFDLVALSSAFAGCLIGAIEPYLVIFEASHNWRHLIIFNKATHGHFAINYLSTVLLSRKVLEASQLAAKGFFSLLLLLEIFLLNHVKCGRIVYARKVHMPLCNAVNRIWRQPLVS